MPIVHEQRPARTGDLMPALGELPPDRLAAKLKEFIPVEGGESTAGDTVGWTWPFSPEDKPYLHTSHTFGYLAPAPPGDKFLPIEYAANITPDVSLKNSRIKVTLDRMRAAEYPGDGEHQVLFDFYAQNQLPGEVEHVHFSATYRIMEGDHAAVISYPIFVGLNVGAEGIAFSCSTVNVKNENDEAFLGFLDSDAFKEGLKLGTQLQPAIAPLSELVVGLTTTLANRNRNVMVQKVDMGLDFSNIPTRARLAEGSYLAVQLPKDEEAKWDWREWVYNPTNGLVVDAKHHKKLIPYNYLVFSVSRYDGP